MLLPHRLWLIVGFVSPWLSGVIASPSPAQIVPDATLGTEASLVSPGVEVRGTIADLIAGGAVRGSNLFHSFLEFNVDAEQRLYFANPAGIEAILSRVTGGNPSNIFGTLGVDGAADLFLINPNGIVFGENAALDVQGSFYASTAEAFPLGDGVYSATEPEQSRLLTVNPSALFSSYLSDASGDIENRGQLAAQGNMTLAANNLDLQGQVAAGNDLTLLGLDTVQIRDGVDTPFVGFAGGDLLVQGNGLVDIVALSHPDSGLYSYGDMVLRSGNPVGGDAHYWSGGSFRVENLDGSAGSLFSPIDPIIRTFGDVFIDQYEGRSLHILAGGSVTLGTATITGADAGTLDNGFLRESIALSDGTVVQVDGGAQPTLDVRAGVRPDVIGTAPLAILTGFDPSTDAFTGNAFVTDAPSTADITVGDVFISAPNGLVLLTNQYQPNTALAGGNIVVTGEGLRGVGIDARGFDEQGGAVYLDARNDVLVINSSIQTSGAGVVGDTVINAGGTVRFDQQNRLSRVASDLVAGTNGTGGSIQITATNVEVLNGAQLSASTFGDGDAGNVVIEADDTVVFDGTSADSQFASAAFSNVAAGAEGVGGNVVVRTSALKVTNGAQLSTSTLGTGDAGNVEIDARDTVTIDGSSVNGQFRSAALSKVAFRAEGAAGNVMIRTSSLTITNRAQLSSASSFGLGDAGNIMIEARDTVHFDNGNASSDVESTAKGAAGNVIVRTGSLSLTNGAQLSASNGGIGEAGNILIEARDTVRIDGFFSGVFSNVGTGAARAGNVVLRTSALDVINGALISTATNNRGDAGNIVIEARDTVRFNGGGALSTVGPDAVGSGGSVVIHTGSLTVTNGAGLATSTLGNGDAGNVEIEARDTVIFNNGDVLSGVGPDAAGAGGDVVIHTGSLTVSNGAQLSTSTLGTGDAGNVEIEARDQVNLQGTGSQGNPSGIFTRNTEVSTGRSNRVQIAAPDLLVQDGAVILASTLNDQPGGDISLDLGSLTVLNGGQVVTGSLGSGPAGTVRINATEGILIAGSDSTFANRVDQIPETSDFVIAQSAISVQASGTGAAGNIIIGDMGTTPRLELNDEGRIIAESAVGDGGNIEINLSNVLLLRNGSLISTTAGTAQAGGDGGNITITVPFIVAIPAENSDIAVDAFEGAGGNVNITARGIFGIEPRPQRTPLSDITASSELGVSGTVAIDTLDTGFIEGSLTNLADTIIDTAALTAGSCIARADDSLGNFVVTGSGGLPQRPGDSGISAYPTGTVRPITESTATLQEPDGVYQLPDGRLVLSHACE